MRFSLKDLEALFDSSFESNFLEKNLTQIGLEVDALEKIEPTYQGVLVAEVLKTSPHPNADRLQVAQVSTGKETLQVVCGASNCRPGLITAFAPVGSSLLDKKGKTLTLKETELRGVTSQGMLLSLEELGYEETSDGIVELDGHFVVGTSLAPYFEDTLIEIGFTPNLGHAMSLLGVARELSCSIKKPFVFPQTTPSFTFDGNKKSIEIQDHQACSQFKGIVINKIKVGPSPLWLQQKLAQLGFNSINNVVDITNYVLYQLGHPLHAYDLEKIDLASLTVKTYEQEKNFLALDSKTYTLPPNVLCVADANRPQSLAGIIGSKHSEVTDSTTSILLEAAVFDPSLIRKTSKKLGISTEASKHFERGVDSNGPKKALEKAAAYILKLAGGQVDHLIEHYPSVQQNKILSADPALINKLLGTQISVSEMVDIFERLEFKPQETQAGLIDLTIPTYRNDITKEIDLVEEVARFYGFENIQHKTPKIVLSPQKDCPLFVFEKKLHELMRKQGLQEVLSCDLISPEMSKLQNPNGPILQALNSVSIDQSILRSTLLGNHLQLVKNNLNVQSNRLHFYEIGKTYSKDKERFTEETQLAITLSGPQDPFYHDRETNPVDYFTLKGLVETLIEEITHLPLELHKSESSLFHPHNQAIYSYEGKPFIKLGQIHPRVLRHYGIKQPVFFAEISVPSLKVLQTTLKEVQPLPAYPCSERDWTLTCLDELQVGHLIEFIKNLESRLLKDVFLLNIFKSDKIGDGNKNVSLRFVYRNDKKTISFEATEVEHARITSLVLQEMKSLIIQRI